MENMNLEVEKVVEETAKVIEEVVPTPAVEKNGLSFGAACGAALITYTAIEGVKWIGGKIVKWAQKKAKSKKEKANDEVFEGELVIDDNEEIAK